MTYLTERLLQKPIMGSQFLRLALISLVALTLQATPASAQCPPGTACWTTTDGVSSYATNSGNVGIGTATPGSLLTASRNQNALTILEVSNTTDGTGARSMLLVTGNGGASALESNAPSATPPSIPPGWANSTVLISTYPQMNLLVVNGGGSSVMRFGVGPTPNMDTNEKMRITGAGNVGIGITNPSVKLHVVGDGKFTGSLTVDGNIAAKYQDVAEWVPASEHISAGTVVVLDSSKSNHVIASSRGYDTRVAGVISQQPGIALGQSGDSKVLVATTGRVRVKVYASHAPIHIGDLLVTSDVPGLAMKSEPVKVGGRLMHMPGTLIGKALEPLAKGRGEILVLLSLQ